MAMASTMPVSWVFQLAASVVSASARAAADPESPRTVQRPGWRRPNRSFPGSGPHGCGSWPHTPATGRSCWRTTPRRRRSRPSLSLLCEVGETYRGEDAQRRQALRQRTEYLDPGALVEAEFAYGNRGANHRNQEAGDSLPGLQQDRDQRGGADGECCPVSLPAEDRLGDLDEVAPGPSLSIEKPNSLGSWLISTVSAMPFM